MAIQVVANGRLLYDGDSAMRGLFEEVVTCGRGPDDPVHMRGLEARAY